MYPAVAKTDEEAPPLVVEVVKESDLPRRRRPGRGLVTFLTFLLSICGIIIFAVKDTRRAALIIYLPIFSLYLLCYIGFLCSVPDDYAEEDNKPAALKEYLKKEKRRRRKQRKEKRKAKGYSLGHGTVVKKDLLSNSAETLEKESMSFDNQVTIAETLSLDTVSEAPVATRAPVINAAENFFESAFPALSKSFETVESQIHLFTVQLNNKLRPPTYCYKCANGAHSDAASTLCIHNTSNALCVPVEDEFGNQELATPSTDMDAMEDVPIISPKVNLTGKYKLFHNHNFMEFLKTQNIPLLLRKAANASRPVHTITHDGNNLRIQVDGFVKGDTTFTINGPTSETNIRHIKFEDHVSYVDDGQAVQVRKVALNAPPNSAVELIIKRQLGNEGHNLILSSKARFRDGSESLESVQTFHRLNK